MSFFRLLSFLTARPARLHVGKMPKRQCKFSDELQKKFPCFAKVTGVKGEAIKHLAKCEVCDRDISVAHSGWYYY